MKHSVFSLSVLVLIALLGGCGFNLLNVPALEFSISSGTLGYEVDPTGGILIKERTLTFRNRAGGLAATVTGYTITFVDSGGNAVNGGDNVSEGSLNVYVPAGIACKEPDPVIGCTVNSPGATFHEVAVTPTQGYQLLPVGIAFAHLNAGNPVEWYGDIQFTGIASTGAPFTTRSYRLAIAPPD